MRASKETKETSRVVKIELGPLSSHTIEIDPSGNVTIRPGRPRETPLPRPLPESPIVEEFRQSCANAADTLLRYNVPGPEDIHSEVWDKLGALDKATRNLLTASRWGEERQLAIQVQLTQEELSSLARSKGILPLVWKQCQNRLASEIAGSVKRFREEQYPKPR